LLTGVTICPFLSGFDHDSKLFYCRSGAFLMCWRDEKTYKLLFLLQ